MICYVPLGIMALAVATFGACLAVGWITAWWLWGRY